MAIEKHFDNMGPKLAKFARVALSPIKKNGRLVSRGGAPHIIGASNILKNGLDARNDLLKSNCMRGKSLQIAKNCLLETAGNIDTHREITNQRPS